MNYNQQREEEPAKAEASVNTDFLGLKTAPTAPQDSCSKSSAPGNKRPL